MRVTIGIPCFNAERWIAQAIESCLSQTWPDVEVIVIDDGSTDASINIIKQYEGRVKVVIQNRLGSNFARNKILDMASGEWIQFLDADDYLYERKIERQIEAAIIRDADVVYGPLELRKYCGNEFKRRLYPENNEEDLPLRWINWALSQTGTLLFRKSSLDRIGGWNEAFPCCQDNELCFRALRAGLKFCYVDHADTVYRIWSEGTISSSNPSLKARIRTELLEQMLDWLEETGLLKQCHKDAVSTICFRLARGQAKNDVKDASAYFSRWQRKGLINLQTATSCSAMYRWVVQIAGFEAAETISDSVRRVKELLPFLARSA